MQKGARLISSHLNQTGLVNKGFILWEKNISCGTQQIILSGQDSTVLPTQVANHSAVFGSSCPLMELVI